MADQQDNLLRELPAELGNSSCTRLDFSGNSLAEVPDALYSNSTLQVLNLAVRTPIYLTTRESFVVGSADCWLCMAEQ